MIPLLYVQLRVWRGERRCLHRAGCSDRGDIVCYGSPEGPLTPGPGLKWMEQEPPRVKEWESEGGQCKALQGVLALCQEVHAGLKCMILGGGGGKRRYNTV